MGAPKYARFSVDFDEWYPQGLYLVGEITPVTEYQSQGQGAQPAGAASAGRGDGASAVSGDVRGPVGGVWRGREGGGGVSVAVRASLA